MDEMSRSSLRERSDAEILIRYDTIFFSISAMCALRVSTWSFAATSPATNPSNAVCIDCIARLAICAASRFACAIATDGVLIKRSSNSARSALTGTSSFLSRMTVVATFTNTFTKGRNRQVHTTLKKVWNIATCVSGFANQRMNVICIKSFQHSSTIMNTTVPDTLNNRWIKLARLAFVFAPSEDRIAVTHEPMLLPRIKNSTSLFPVPIVRPAPTMTITSEVITELDCTIAVKIIPTNNNKNALSISERNCCICGTSL